MFSFLFYGPLLKKFAHHCSTQWNGDVKKLSQDLHKEVCTLHVRCHFFHLSTFKFLNDSYLVGCQSEQQELDTVEIKTVHSFKTLGINNLVTQPNNTEDLNYKQHSRTLKFKISLKTP